MATTLIAQHAHDELCLYFCPPDPLVIAPPCRLQISALAFPEHHDTHIARVTPKVPQSWLEGHLFYTLSCSHNTHTDSLTMTSPFPVLSAQKSSAASGRYCVSVSM